MSRQNAKKPTPKPVVVVDRQTLRFVRALKEEPTRETIMGSVYAAIKKLKRATATELTKQAIANGVTDNSGQSPRVQTLVMLQQLVTAKAVTRHPITSATKPAKTKAAPSAHRGNKPGTATLMFASPSLRPHLRARAPSTRRISETDDRQNARTVCSIGTQPVIPAVYGVKAPL